jgi:hypothetical protein
MDYCNALNFLPKHVQFLPISNDKVLWFVYEWLTQLMLVVVGNKKIPLDCDIGGVLSKVTKDDAQC